MEIKIIGSSKVGYIMPIEDALIFGSQGAGICYMPYDFESILKEDVEKTEKRIQHTLKSGHHSVYDHPTYNLLFIDIPKILAMVLNNEGLYTTSEKSARYTKMNPTELEKHLYGRWIDILINKIQDIYPRIPNNTAKRLAQENARYMISVFTPTTMEYTVSLRQISYIINMMKKFINEAEDTCFNAALKKCMEEFIFQMKEFDIPHLDGNLKGRKLSLFDDREDRQNEFGENYSVNYMGSFAQLAQAQRHRTLDYRMKVIEDYPAFYVPPIIRAKNNNGSNELEELWIKDMQSAMEVVPGRTPQGMLVRINERGTYENFILKAKERLCGSAQLEIAEQTGDILSSYITNTIGKNSSVQKELEKYIEKTDEYGRTGGDINENNLTKDDKIVKGIKLVPRCKFQGWRCSSPCIWGAKGMERLI